MKKKILIPTDFSKNAFNAIRYAVELYKEEEVDFYILNSYFSTGYTTDNLLIPESGSGTFEAIKMDSENAMEKLKNNLKAIPNQAGHTYHYLCEFGLFLEVVKNSVATYDIELIVMGSRGETDNTKIVFGSNTVVLMEKIRECPVLAIPGTASFKGLNEIVFPTGFKNHFKRRELEHLCEISRITKAPIRVLHVSKTTGLSQEQKEQKTLLEACFNGLEYTFHFLDTTHIQTALNIFTESRNSEMIAFINKKHSFFEMFFSKPLVRDLGYNPKVPVLALHDLQK